MKAPRPKMVAKAKIATIETATMRGKTPGLKAFDQRREHEAQ